MYTLPKQWLLTWTTWLAAIMLCYVYTISQPGSDNQQCTTQYQPKSKRNRLHKVLKAVQKWLDDLDSRYNQGSMSRTELTRYRHTLARARQHSGLTPRRRWYCRTQMAAMAAVALSARSDKHDHNVFFDTDSAIVGIDNRCTACITPYLDDFELPPGTETYTIKGFGGSRSKGAKKGTVVWKFSDDKGAQHTFRIPNSFYVPDCEYRLFSPQHWAQSQGAKKYTTGCDTTGYASTLYWFAKGEGTRCTLTVPHGRNDNVSTFRLAEGYTKYAAFHTEVQSDIGTDDDPICLPVGIISDDEDDDEMELAGQRMDSPSRPATDNPRGKHNPPNTDHDHVMESEGDTDSEGEQSQKNDTPQTIHFNLDGPTTDESPVIIEEEEDRIPDNNVAELLRMHYRFDHLPIPKLQEMAKQGILPKRLAKCAAPTCSACLYAKAQRRPWRQKSAKNYRPPRKITRPGQVVSVDQLKSPTPGLVAQMTGRLTTARYNYATVYVDHHSRFGYVYFQKTQSAEETIESKRSFEEYSRRHGVMIEAYHADNGVFRAHKWVDQCKEQQQGLTFAAVGAHHSNGMAERRIKELQGMTRASLIFANHRWSQAITANLWPYAMRLVNQSINSSPSMQDQQRRSPDQIFSKSTVMPNPKHYKPFGCPTYVLDAQLQAGKPHGKWEERSKVGIYLGTSPTHPRNVPLVLSLTTGLVSPQFHIKYDSSFSTVKDLLTVSNWQLKAGFVTQRESNQSHEEASKQIGKKRKKRNTQQRMHSEPGPHSNNRKRARVNSDRTDPGAPDQETDHSDQQSEDVDQLGTSVPNPEGGLQLEAEPPRLQQSHRQSDDGQAPPTANEEVQNPVRTSRTGRVRKPVQRLIAAMESQIDDPIPRVQDEILCLQSVFPDHASYEATNSDPLVAYKATADPDTMYLHEAMKEPDRAEFVKAMQKEVNDQMANGNYTIVRRQDVPKGHKVFRAVWQMKRKRDIKTRQVKKWKARLNLDGSSMEKGKHYDLTYAPVARWNSIRLLLTMAALHKWHTTQIDYVLAFPQAPVEREVYMSVPKGFEFDGRPGEHYVLKLNKNVYGQKSAGRVWNQYLTKKLVKEVGFTQSKIDECVFYKGSVMYVLYTDDSILAGPSKREIDKVIQQIKAANLDITIEGDIQDFLGVHIQRKHGKVTLSQPHLIDSILKDLRLDGDNVKSNKIPAASSKILTKFPNSQPFDGSFHYRRVIGKLNYLEKGSRSDIAYIVHQCARFVESPKKEHGDALRWLGRYLKATKDKGTIYTPVESKGLEVYVDASFSQDWNPSEADDRDTARSRHGYYIMYAGCPILWKSQLQTEICLSSTESEYTGCSYALREAIPMIELLRELKSQGIPIQDSQPQVHCKVFEDNSGALEMAREHKYRPRTKHLNVKLHHFRDYVTRGAISIHKIGTLEQLADILTKPVNQDILEYLRPKILGW